LTREEKTAAQATAARRLGDFFVPPRGTKLRIFERRWPGRARRVGVVIVGSSCATEIKVGPPDRWADDSEEGRRLQWWVDPSNPFEVLDFDRVEGEVPPFEAWRRPTAEDLALAGWGTR